MRAHCAIVLPMVSLRFTQVNSTLDRRSYITTCRLSTCIYLLALVLTLVSAVVLHSVGLGRPPHRGAGVQKAMPEGRASYQAMLPAVPAQIMHATSASRCRQCCDAPHPELGCRRLPRSCWHCVTQACLAPSTGHPVHPVHCDTVLGIHLVGAAAGCGVFFLQGAGVVVLWSPHEEPGAPES